MSFNLKNVFSLKMTVVCLTAQLSFSRKSLTTVNSRLNFQLKGYLSNLKRRGVLDKIGWTPKRQKRKASTREEKNEPAKPSLNASNLPIREMLEASLMLLDSHPKVAKFLLERCVEALK